MVSATMALQWLVPARAAHPANLVHFIQVRVGRGMTLGACGMTSGGAGVIAEVVDRAPCRELLPITESINQASFFWVG